MAEIVLGIGTSHTPLLTLEGHEWHHRSQSDRVNKRLTLADGRIVDYEGLVALRGELYSAEATEERFVEAAQRCQQHLDRLAKAIAEARPDVIVIVGDDQNELYTPGNIPAIAMYYGAVVVTHNYDDEIPEWMKTVARGYGMDEIHRFPGHPQFALDLIERMIARDVDLAVANDVPNPEVAGFGHAFGFPAERLFGGREIPMVPIMLNTYYPPNVLYPSRCHHIGNVLRDAIESSPLDLRVAVLASGGLSHFVVEEDLDRRVLAGLSQSGGELLRSLPPQALLEGSSEILNWVMTAGAVSHLPLAWSAYEPVRRTPAGTGVGCGFAIWKKEPS